MQKHSRLTRFVIVLAMAGVLVAPTRPGVCKDASPIADVVAEVNGASITGPELDLEITSRKKYIEQQGKTVDADILKALQAQSLESLINSELFYQESIKKGILADEAKIDFQIESVRQQFMDDTEFEKMLSGIGFTPDGLRRHFEKAVAVEKLIETAIVDNVNISVDVMKGYYEKHAGKFKIPAKVRVSHILIPTGADPSPAEKIEARKQIEKIEKQLKKGKDFGALAKAFSKCPSAEKGGDIGFFSRGEMEKPFEEAAFALQPGQMSSIVMTSQGYHLLKLYARTEESTALFENVKKDIEQFLKTEKVRKEVDAYLGKLRKSATIRTYRHTWVGADGKGSDI